MSAAGASPRAYLFVPADRPERYAKARASAADAVIVDLEDAVAPAANAGARDALANALDEAMPVVVRINAAGTPWFEDDLELCRHPGVAGVMLPKADGIDAVCSAFEACFKDVLAIIESARGIEEARNIARVPGVVRLAPSLVVTDEQVDGFVQALPGVLDSALQDSALETAP